MIFMLGDKHNDISDSNQPNKVTQDKKAIYVVFISKGLIIVLLENNSQIKIY